MNLYRTFNISNEDDALWHGTRAEAHAEAKQLQPREDARIELVAVPTDKNGMVATLNGVKHDAEQTWRLSPRGGLVECPNGE